MSFAILTMLLIGNIILALNPEANRYIALFNAFAAGFISMALIAIFQNRT